jgi:hypothetical protein
LYVFLRTFVSFRGTLNLDHFPDKAKVKQIYVVSAFLRRSLIGQELLTSERQGRVRGYGEPLKAGTVADDKTLDEALVAAGAEQC